MEARTQDSPGWNNTNTSYSTGTNCGVEIQLKKSSIRGKHEQIYIILEGHILLQHTQDSSGRIFVLKMMNNTFEERHLVHPCGASLFGRT